MGTNDAYCVHPDGDVVTSGFSDVYSSYGRRSPVTGDDYDAWQVYPDGYVDDDYSFSVIGSYGRYNIISQSTVTNLDAFTSTTTGDIDHAGNTSIYTYSYGIFQSHRMLVYHLYVE